MKANILILIMVVAGLFSCEQGGKSTTDTVDVKALDSTKNVQNKKSFIYTEHEYADSVGASLIIQNSLPKGGTRYIDLNGEMYFCAIFWTRIVNETANSLKLDVKFPVNSYEVPSLPSKYFKVLIPSDTMTLDKESLFNYGLTNLKPFLDNGIHKPATLKRTINPKESSGFYVAILCLAGGAHGILRTGFSLEGQSLFYVVNSKKISCGSISLKNLTLQK